MTTWVEIEDGLATDMGYNLRGCDKWWIIVTLPGHQAHLDGYDLALLCEGFRWHLDMWDDVLCFNSFVEAKRYRDSLPRRAFTGVMGLGDYWRRGRIPPAKLRFAASERTLAMIEEGKTRLRLV